jgi:hypothetical protein
MSRREVYPWRRLLAGRSIGVLAILLLAHAVALATMHHHGTAAGRSAGAVAAAPSLAETTSYDEVGGCPACQLQQNFSADLPRLSEAFAAERPAFLLPTERLRTILRAGDTSPPDRAPPAL